MKTKKILYFTVVNLAKTDNGGGLACRNHARRIAMVDNVELTICCATRQEDYDGVKEFSDSIGASLAFIPFVEDSELPVLKNGILWEAEALRQSYTDRKVIEFIEALDIEILVVDYLYSALFVRSAYRRRNLRRITITLNREVEFMRDLHRRGLLGAKTRKTEIISELRLMLFEQTIYSRSHMVIALTRRDLPWPRPGVSRKVVIPVFDRQPVRWSGEDGHNVFFIGNIGHYPNHEAVAWLTDRLSPELLRIGSSAMIDIIGATPEQMGISTIPQNLRFHGRADALEAVRQFTSCGLLIAPIRNPFGSKMKVLDGLSFGTPVVATRAALSGIPSIAELPLISLEDPSHAAVTIEALLADKPRRKALGLTLSDKLDQFLADQQQIWQDIL